MEDQENIHEKGFNTYNKIKVNKKTLENVALNLDALKPGYMGRYGNQYYTSKRALHEALARNDVHFLRQASNYFYRTSGMYQRACNYFATLYRYDWYVVPEIFKENTKSEIILKEFKELLNLLDNSHVSKMCGDIALSVIKNGAYYGYIISTDEKIVLQELPIEYCRTIYNLGDLPVIEMNMRFFDEKFPNTAYRNKVLKLFPKDIQQGYVMYKKGQLVDDNITSGHYHGTEWDKCWDNGWYVLDPELTIKFSFANSTGNQDLPLFISSLPAILDLDDAVGLDRKRQMQQLIKILIQKLPIDKNGDLVFDVDEAADIHANAVSMLMDTIGVDVLTTFAEVQDIDLSDASEASNDAVSNAIKTVYRSMGISENLFDTEGNLALDKSIKNDEATVRTLVLQFGVFWNRVVQLKNKHPKQYKFRLYMLETTQNNYTDLADKYKAQVQIGYSKMLPQIALGHSQSSILNTAYFENEILNLSTLMIPPLQSSVMNAETLQMLGKKGQQTTDSTQDITDDSAVGRPEKPDGEKSEKTIANQESQS